MGLFDKIKEPVFLKEKSSATEQLIFLQELQKSAPKEAVTKIEREIKLLNAGILGEKQIIFELKNSHIPMFVLHDLYLEFNEHSAQIDFLLITRKCNFVIECKNLFGNVEINTNGDFIRTISYNKHFIKEGIYSPITQNQRHLELIKEMRTAERGNILTKTLFEKNFYNNYRSVVVLANPQTVLNTRYAKKEIKQQVIRADQLISYIKKAHADYGSSSSNETDMQELAHFFLGQHHTNMEPVLQKYNKWCDQPFIEKEDLSATNCAVPPVASSSTCTVSKEIEIDSPEFQTSQPEELHCPRCGALMIKRKVKKGERAGEEFYGCSKFPKCWGTVQITKA